MSKNLTRKGMALASGAALALTSLVGVAAPAVAATGDVVIGAKTGVGTTAFATDNFTLTTTVKTSKVAAATLAYRIDNPDQHQLHIDATSNNADIYGIKADGTTVATGLGDDKAFGVSGLAVDFVDLGIVSLLIYELDTGTVPAATGNDLVIQLDEASFSNSASQAVDPLEHNDLTGTAQVTVTAWVETAANPTLAAHLSVDADYSSSAVVTFVDPADISAITAIERYATATGNDPYQQADSIAVAAATADVVVDDSSNALLPGSFGGTTIAAGDLVLLTGQDTSAENGLYTVPASGNIVTEVLNVATDIYVSGGTSAGVVFSGDGTDALTAITADSNAVTALNDGNANFLGGSLRFSNSNINLAQVNLANWQFEVDGEAADDTGFLSATLLYPLTPVGYSTVDGAGKLFVQAPVDDLNLDDAQTYKLNVRHSGATSVVFYSSGYQVVTSPSATANRLAITLGDTANVSVAAHGGSNYPVTVRNGTSSVKFNVQVQSGADTANEVANVPLLAIVTAGSSLPAGETIQVTGGNRVISKSQTQIVTALTDSDGEWDLTVTSSDASSAGSNYTVQFFALDGATPDAWITTDGAQDSIYAVDYALPVLASANAFTASSEVASGDSVTVTFSVVDQYDTALSTDATGKTYSVELKATNDDNLDLDAEVVGGNVSFTFANYLGEGESDVLTARLYTGSSSSPSFVAGQSDNITLYRTNAVAGVNVNANFTGVVVEYKDFFNGKAATGQAVPVDGNKQTLSGTVVDSNGAGVPGAPVTVSATGFAFEVASTYAVDTIDVIADASGSFSVDFWTHVLTAVGADITVTSGGKTATSTVKSVLPTTLDGQNLRLTWSVPAAVVMNTTYAVTATLTDVFGNPIAGQILDFAGLAAAEFNSGVTAARTTGADGVATAYLRSVKDVDGLAAISVTIDATDNPSGVTTFNNDNVTTALDDVVTTSWNESLWRTSLTQEVNFLKSASDIVTAQKVNAGSFKGYVALYAKGYEGQRMSAKVGNDWVIVAAIPAATNDLFRAVEFVGAGVEISVRLYIDRVLVATIPLLTK